MKKQGRDDRVLFFEDRYYMFSNFSSFAVRYHDVLWMTAEHAYQAAKFFGPAPDTVTAIGRARSAYDAKRIARKNDSRRRPNWDTIKLVVMEEILRAKVEQHPYVKEMLLETGEREIIEDSYKDAFWGRGPNWKGENHLGKLWMKLRSELR